MPDMKRWNITIINMGIAWNPTPRHSHNKASVTQIISMLFKPTIAWSIMHVKTWLINAMYIILII